MANQEKLDEAIVCYRKAIELDPKFADPHTNLGSALANQHRLDEAIAWHHKAIEIDPKHVNAHIDLGNALYSQRKLDEAIAWYRKAIEIDPKYAAAHFNLGHVLKAQGKVDEAIACFRKAIEIDPKFVDAFTILGNALSSQKKLDDAIACYRKAVELDSQSVLVWQQMGWAEYRTGNWRGSIVDLEKSCKLQAGGKGDSAQWIVMSLAHGKLANEKKLPEQERDRHKTEARRWFDQAVKEIDSQSAREDSVATTIRAFRAEAAELLGVKDETEVTRGRHGRDFSPLIHAKRPVRPYRQASSSPARHRPGARSAHWERCLSILSQTGREDMKRLTLIPTLRRPIRRRPPASRLCLESLEDRCLLSFSPAVSYPVGASPQAVVTGDFNGDGRLDLAVANSASNTVSILRGNANGTFQAAQNFATGAVPRSLAVGDFNKDGKLDLAYGQCRCLRRQRALGQRRRHLPGPQQHRHRLEAIVRGRGRLQQRR